MQGNMQTEKAKSCSSHGVVLVNSTSRPSLLFPLASWENRYRQGKWSSQSYRWALTLKLEWSWRKWEWRGNKPRLALWGQEMLPDLFTLAPQGPRTYLANGKLPTNIHWSHSKYCCGQGADEPGACCLNREQGREPRCVPRGMLYILKIPN